MNARYAASFRRKMPRPSPLKHVMASCTPLMFLCLDLSRAPTMICRMFFFNPNLSSSLVYAMIASSSTSAMKALCSSSMKVKNRASSSRNTSPSKSASLPRRPVRMACTMALMASFRSSGVRISFANERTSDNAMTKFSVLISLKVLFEQLISM